MKLFLALLLLFPVITGNASELCKKLKIAVIDTGLDINDSRFQDHICPSGHKDFTGTTLKDVNGHGTHVTGLIQQYAGNSDYCFLIYKYYTDSNPGSINLKNEIAAINEAVENEASIVNVSGGGPEFSEYEYLAIKNNPNVLFVTAAGNEHQNVDIPENHYYPASYGLPNIISVGNIDILGKIVPSSNYGSSIKVWERGENIKSTIPNGRMSYMTGTSQATAIHTGKLIKEKSLECIGK